jgi:transposase
MYHAFGVRKGYEYHATKYVEGRVEFHLRVEKDHLKCPDYGSTPVHRRGGRTRRICSVPIGLKETVLVVEGPQCHCPACDKSFEVSSPLPAPTSDTAYPCLGSSAE